MSSYVVDKDLLQSARLTTTTTQSMNWIDVNSNTALLGSTSYYRSSDAEMKKQIGDVIYLQLVNNLKFSFLKLYVFSFKIN